MKKEIIKPLAFWAAAELLLFAVFVLKNSVFALFGFAFLLLLAAATFGMAFFARNGISAKTVLPPTAEKGSEICGKIILENRSALPVFRAVCEVIVKNKLTGEENGMNIAFSVPAKGKAEADFSLSSEYCGYVTAKAEKVYLTDIFGFLFIGAKDFSSAKGKMTVLPETFEPIIVFDGILPVPEDSESYSPDKKGYDYSETFQIREYAPGDSMKQIHWKLSEKLDKTIVRDASLPVAKNIMLFWDKTAGKAGPSETDAMAEVASSVAQSLLKSGYNFMLGWNDGNRIEMREIKTEEDLLEAVPRIIKFGAEEGEIPDYSGLFENYGKVIAVAKEPPESLLERPGANLLICGEGAKGNNVISFGHKTYTEDLEFLEFGS
ncbi:MAG: DUF58 domain-containing protein [Oscillospiraceae bacterium]|nr:DUF58 domain-containing protein [Oscillospiraceae bacterium]